MAAQGPSVLFEPRHPPFSRSDTEGTDEKTVSLFLFGEPRECRVSGIGLVNEELLPVEHRWVLTRRVVGRTEVEISKIRYPRGGERWMGIGVELWVDEVRHAGLIEMQLDDVGVVDDTRDDPAARLVYLQLGWKQVESRGVYVQRVCGHLANWCGTGRGAEGRAFAKSEEKLIGFVAGCLVGAEEASDITLDDARQVAEFWPAAEPCDRKARHQVRPSGPRGLLERPFSKDVTENESCMSN